MSALNPVYCDVYIKQNLPERHAMGFEYRKASIKDLDLLVKTRIEVLRAANKLSMDTDMSGVEAESYKYYESAFENGSHTAYLVFDNDKVIGAGDISYYTVMPTYHNPSGKKAYVMNMYTNPDYRRKGIAMKTLDLLVSDARNRGVNCISLEATDMGRPLYEKYGFVQMQCEMELLTTVATAQRDTGFRENTI